MESHESSQPRPDVTPQGNDASAPVEPELTPRQWLLKNGPVLALAAALLIFLYTRVGGDGLWAVAKAAIGLGLVIFIHELGHFLVAKWCDVNVQVFSIGFGPALPGCQFVWGETTYKLALFPLGGYVQMVGQVDLDETSDGTENDPRSYKNKSVWQRMAIISAGVTMNVILAVICFVTVFLGPGKTRRAAIIDRIDSNSPAFRDGLHSNQMIEKIDSIEQPYFEDVMFSVVLTNYGESVPLTVRLPGGAERSLEIEPRMSEGKRSLPKLGIGPASSAALIPRRFAPKGLESPALLRSAASRATRVTGDTSQAPTGFAFDDSIVATTDPADPTKVTDLPPDPWQQPGSEQRDYFAFARRMQQLAGQEVVIRVERKQEDGSKRTVDLRVAPAFHRVLDVRMQMGQVLAVRRGYPATSDPNPANRVQARTKVDDSVIAGDVIQKVEIKEPDGTTTRFVEDPARRPRLLATAVLMPGPLQAAALHQALYDETNLDPVRLPYQLKQWASRMARSPVPKEQWQVKLYVRRHNHQGGPHWTDAVLDLNWDSEWTYDDVEPLSQSSPLAIPELGLSYEVKATVAGVEPFASEEVTNALQAGDVIEQIQFHYATAEGATEETEWIKMVNKDAEAFQQPDRWAWAFHQAQGFSTLEYVTLKVNHNGDVKERKIRLQEDKTWPLKERGLLLMPATRLQKADNFFQALGMGLKDARRSMMQVYLTLRGMIIGRISVDNLGGPGTIAHSAYMIAGVDIWEFVFFLGLISINLAVINFLPIPVLDGGHMVFLVYEKIRGKPASEAVRVGATYAGLLVLASLMLFVIYLDITHFLSP